MLAPVPVRQLVPIPAGDHLRRFIPYEDKDEGEEAQEENDGGGGQGALKTKRRGRRRRRGSRRRRRVIWCRSMWRRRTRRR